MSRGRGEREARRECSSDQAPFPLRASYQTLQVGSPNVKSHPDVLVTASRMGLGPKVSVGLFAKRRKVTDLLDCLPGKEMTLH